MNTDGPTKVKISDRVSLQLPPGYEKKPLPGLKAWVAALRSGKYAQGRGALRSMDDYCCLGVLCEIEGLQAVPLNTTLYRYDGCTSQLPRQVRQSVHLGGEGVLGGLVDCWLLLDGVKRHMTTLTQLNDSGGTFEEIALVIETLWIDKEQA